MGTQHYLPQDVVITVSYAKRGTFDYAACSPETIESALKRNAFSTQAGTREIGIVINDIDAAKKLLAPFAKNGDKISIGFDKKGVFLELY